MIRMETISSTPRITTEPMTDRMTPRGSRRRRRAPRSGSSARLGTCPDVMVLPASNDFRYQRCQFTRGRVRPQRDTNVGSVASRPHQRTAAMSAAVGDVEAGRVGERVARPVTIPALAGIGAGAIHAAAVGAHADHRVLTNIFVVLAVSQLATGVALLVQPGRAVAKAVVAVNGFAVAGWLLSRTVGVWLIAGLGVERPG